MIYLPGASWLMLVLGALLSETDTYHHTSQLLLQDGEDDEDLWQVRENLKKEIQSVPQCHKIESSHLVIVRNVTLFDSSSTYQSSQLL